MAASNLFWIGLGWWAITTLVQWLSAALALRRRPVPPSRHKAKKSSAATREFLAYEYC